jgi:hypothetical protein
MLHRQRVRSPTVGFALIRCAPRNGGEGGGGRGGGTSAFLTLRSTATGDLFVRRCEVGSAEKAAVATRGAHANDKKAWSLWASDAAGQDNRLRVPDEQEGDDDGCDDNGASVGESVARKALAKVEATAKRDCVSMVALLSRGRPESARAAVATTTAPASAAGDTVAALEPSQVVADSAELLSSVEARIASDGPRTLWELCDDLRDKHPLLGARAVLRLVRASTKVVLMHELSGSDIDNRVEKVGEDIDAAAAATDDDGELAGLVVGPRLSSSPAVVAGVDGSKTFDVDAYWRSDAPTTAAASASAGSATAQKQAWAGTPQPLRSAAGAAMPTSNNNRSYSAGGARTPGLFKSPASGKKPKKQKIATPRRAGF